MSKYTMDTSKSEVIVFDVWAPFAYFRKPFTTTSALSFNFIPRSAIEGLIGAILGIRRSDLYVVLANSKIGLEKDRRYAIEQNIPARLNQDRELMSSFSALYNPNGKPIKVRNINVKSFFDRNGIETNFVFLPS
jgi:CRISPR-associated Cas5-like protein